MKRIVLLVLSVSVFTFAASAHAVSPTADVVHLRTDCTGVTDCFTTTSALTNWLWGTGSGVRAAPPSAGDRVSVLVGPGTFDKFVCDATSTPTGWVSVIGSGRGHTRFEANSGSADQEFLFSNGIFCHGAITAYGCTDLNFQDLTAYGSDTGVFWLDGGNATWTDVDMIGGGAARVPGCAFSTTTYGWVDNGSGPNSTHFLFGCRAIGLGTNGGYNAAIAQHHAELWFWGGDVLAQPDYAGTGITAQFSVELSGDSEFHGFGTSIRNLVGASTQIFPVFTAVNVTGQSKFHMHGGVITSDGSGSTGNQGATALSAVSNGFAHAHETAFAVKPGGTGLATRLATSGNGKIEAPFQWEQRTTPPSITSKNGADMFVDTAAGTGNNEAHLMVYDTACTGAGGPWRDMVGGACRVP